MEGKSDGREREGWRERGDGWERGRGMEGVGEGWEERGRGRVSGEREIE